MCGSLAKDFHKLMKNIASFSNNQAEVCQYEEDLEAFKVEILPKDGVYCGGKFDFQVTLKDYPKMAPTVTCVTRIYHPNIDNESGDICLNLFDEWTETNTLEDCVQGLLFLLYNPNLEDPLSPLFDPESDNDFDGFAENVRRSLEGGEVEGCTFERNLVNEEKDTCINNSSDSVPVHVDDKNWQQNQNESEGSDMLSNGCEAVAEKNENVDQTKAVGHELNRTAITENTNGEIDLISGKIHPHRTEENISVCATF